MIDTMMDFSRRTRWSENRYFRGTSQRRAAHTESSGGGKVTPQSRQKGLFHRREKEHRLRNEILTKLMIPRQEAVVKERLSWELNWFKTDTGRPYPACEEKLPSTLTLVPQSQIQMQQELESTALPTSSPQRHPQFESPDPASSSEGNQS